MNKIESLPDVWPWKVAVGLGSLALLTLMYARRRRTWRAVGKLSHLYIYPVKSGSYKELDSAECTDVGLRVSLGDGLATLRDRVFGIYCGKNMEFVTARKYPTLILITVEPKSENKITFSHPDCESIDLTLPNGMFKGNTVTMWKKEELQIIDCGDEISKWVSQLALGLDEGLRVAFWPENETWRRDVLSLRPEEIEVYKNFKNQFSGSYSDLASYLLVNQSSVEDLTTKLEDSDVKIGALNFRPNLVIEGAIPYEEEKWDRIKIGEVEFTNFRPCTRCSLTTINYNTGQRNPNNEPLRTLRTYRTMKMLGEPRIEPTTPVLGIYIGLEKSGIIKAGDTVYVS